MRIPCVLVVAVTLAGCGTDDNQSAVTDRSRGALVKAQSEVTDKRSDLATRQDQVAHERSEIVQHSQALIDHERALAAEREKLGSAKDSLVQARETYSIAVSARLAKLDASLASAATKTDASTKDAVVGLRARREQLATKIASLHATPAPDFAAYTKDVDTTFDAIERDLHDALRR